MAIKRGLQEILFLSFLVVVWWHWTSTIWLLRSYLHRFTHFTGIIVLLSFPFLNFNIILSLTHWLICWVVSLLKDLRTKLLLAHFVCINWSFIIGGFAGSYRIPILTRRNLVFNLMNINSGLVIGFLRTKYVGGIIHYSIFSSSPFWNRSHSCIVVLWGVLRSMLRVWNISSWRNQVLDLEAVLGAVGSSIAVELTLGALSCTIIAWEHFELWHGLSVLMEAWGHCFSLILNFFIAIESSISSICLSKEFPSLFLSSSIRKNCTLPILLIPSWTTTNHHLSAIYILSVFNCFLCITFFIFWLIHINAWFVGFGGDQYCFIQLAALILLSGRLLHSGWVVALVAEDVAVLVRGAGCRQCVVVFEHGTAWARAALHVLISDDWSTELNGAWKSCAVPNWRSCWSNSPLSRYYMSY